MSTLDVYEVASGTGDALNLGNGKVPRLLLY